MNIIILKNGTTWGGMEHWVFETSCELLKRGHDVIVGCHPKSLLSTKCQEEGVTVKNLNIKTNSVLNLFKLLTFYHYLKTQKIEAIIVGSSADRKFGILGARLAGVKKIIHRQGGDLKINNTFYNRLLLGKYTTNIIANSLSTRDTMLKGNEAWLKKDMIKIIYNGVKVKKYSKPKLLTNIREEFHINPNRLIMVNIGRLGPQKGHTYLIEAINQVREVYKDFHLLIVGKGPLENDLKNKVNEMNLNDYITFTGFREDIPSILAQIDFLVHTALWEGFGFVLAEAMAASKPIVAMDASNISELVIPGKNGYLAKYKNTNDISSQIIKMCQAKNRKELGQNGLEIVKTRFSFQRMVDQVEELMQY